MDNSPPITPMNLSKMIPGRPCQSVGMCSLLSHPMWGGQIFLAQKFRVEQLGLIALSAIREDGHDGLAGT